MYIFTHGGVFNVTMFFVIFECSLKERPSAEKESPVTDGTKKRKESPVEPRPPPPKESPSEPKVNVDIYIL